MVWHWASKEVELNADRYHLYECPRCGVSYVALKSEKGCFVCEENDMDERNWGPGCKKGKGKKRKGK